jgi:hypothetical protein
MSFDAMVRKSMERALLIELYDNLFAVIPSHCLPVEGRQDIWKVGHLGPFLHARVALVHVDTINHSVTAGPTEVLGPCLPCNWTKDPRCFIGVFTQVLIVSSRARNDEIRVVSPLAIVLTLEENGWWPGILDPITISHFQLIQSPDRRVVDLRGSLRQEGTIGQTTLTGSIKSPADRNRVRWLRRRIEASLHYNYIPNSQQRTEVVQVIRSQDRPAFGTQLMVVSASLRLRSGRLKNQFGSIYRMRVIRSKPLLDFHRYPFNSLPSI